MITSGMTHMGVAAEEVATTLTSTVEATIITIPVSFGH